MATERTCATCGHVNSGDALFCSKCGARVKEPVAETPTVSQRKPEKTPDPEQQPEPEKKAPQRRVAGAARTQLGVPMTAPAPAAPPPGVEVGAAPDGPSPANRVAGSARTMLGMPAPDAAQIQEAIANAKRTVAEKEQAENEQADIEARVSEPNAAIGAAAEGARPQAPPRKKDALGPSHRTMLGQPAPRAEIEEAEKAKAEKEKQAAAEEPAPERKDAVADVPSMGSFSDSDLVLPTRRTGRGFLIGMVAIGGVALLGAAGLIGWMVLNRTPNLSASVVQGDQGEMLDIEVPGAAAGTRVRFRGVERPLEAGHARFPLAADALALGDNELNVDVVDPGGSASTVPVQLHLEFRVRADLGPLNAVPPAVDVHVEAPVGSQVTLDGQPLTLDAHGHGQRRYPVEPGSADAEGVVHQIVHYIVQTPHGAPAQGDLRTQIPVTTMQVDRPGENLVTDRAEVEIAGAVAPSATLTIDGREVQVQSGHFLERVPVALGERTFEVVARAPGKAPRIQRIRVRRVADLEAEAAAFGPDPQLTYGRISTNPNTYRGQKVEFHGMVYNVDIRDGRSVIQMLVDQCPQGDRCSLWVTYAAATDAQVRSRVRVLGTVAGEQQFRSQSGQVRTVPRVDAAFVLPERRGR